MTCCTSVSSRTTSRSASAGGYGCSAVRTVTSGHSEARHGGWAGAEFTAESRSHFSVSRLPAAS